MPSHKKAVLVRNRTGVHRDSERLSFFLRVGLQANTCIHLKISASSSGGMKSALLDSKISIHLYLFYKVMHRPERQVKISLFFPKYVNIF